MPRQLPSVWRINGRKEIGYGGKRSAKGLFVKKKTGILAMRSRMIDGDDCRSSPAVVTVQSRWPFQGKATPRPRGITAVGAGKPLMMEYLPA